LLKDRILAVRIETASALAEVTPQIPEQGALADYFWVQKFNADRPESHMNEGLMDSYLKKYSEAESQYKKAIETAPFLIQSYVNLADLYRITGRDSDGEKILQKALSIDPKNAEAQHALGLLMVRQHKLDDAIPLLASAAKLNPD